MEHTILRVPRCPSSPFLHKRAQGSGGAPEIPDSSDPGFRSCSNKNPLTFFIDFIWRGLAGCAYVRPTWVTAAKGPQIRPALNRVHHVPDPLCERDCRAGACVRARATRALGPQGAAGYVRGHQQHPGDRHPWLSDDP
eukprot:scaffold1081_cov219-Pinguiococcus_pyrenoidosus.AAC.2